MKSRFLAAALLAVSCVFTFPAIAYEPGHFYVIQSKLDGRVLTAEGDATLLGSDRHQPAPVAMRPATGAKNQLWYVERAPGWQGANGMFYIRNYVGGRVLDVEGWQTNVITYPRTSNVAWNQLWVFHGASIRTYATNSEWKCLDVLYKDWRYGPNLGSWSCNGNTNQQWEWVRKDRIVPIGDSHGRTTVASVGSLRFVRPLTPQEADAYDIAGLRAYDGIPGTHKPYVLHRRSTGHALCGRIVAQGLANWRLPTRNEFAQLLAAHKPWGATKAGAALTHLGWVNAQHWSSEVHPNAAHLFRQLWPDDLSIDSFYQDGAAFTEALVTCVR